MPFVARSLLVSWSAVRRQFVYVVRADTIGITSESKSHPNHFNFKSHSIIVKPPSSLRICSLFPFYHSRRSSIDSHAGNLNSQLFSTMNALESSHNPTPCSPFPSTSTCDPFHPSAASFARNRRTSLSKSPDRSDEESSFIAPKTRKIKRIKRKSTITRTQAAGSSGATTEEDCERILALFVVDCWNAGRVWKSRA